MVDTLAFVGLQDVEIPQNRIPSGYREYDDNSFCLIKPNRRGLSKILQDNYEFRVETLLDLKKVFKSRFNWTYSILGEFECILKPLTEDQLRDLYYFGETCLQDGTNLYYIPGTPKMRLGDRSATKTLINVAPWLLPSYKADTIDKLKFVVSKIQELNSSLPINLTSPASTTKDLLIAEAPREFSLINKLDQKSLKFFHAVYTGPRQESKFIGTENNLQNADGIKAYLRALGRFPSLNLGSINKIVDSKEFLSDAHPGSAYRVEVTVPRTYTGFAPLPHRNGKITYPVGTFEAYLNKTQMDLIIELGDIPYTILESRQIITFEEPTYPFKNLARVIEGAENVYREQLYPLNLKFLHTTLAGHMLHIHKVYEKDASSRFVASQDYNPIAASFMQNLVATEVWKLAIARDAEAIRVDAVSGKNLLDAEGFKTEKAGTMTFLTPVLKDKPGSSIYRDLITTYRDAPWVPIKVPKRYTLKESLASPKRLGEEHTLSATIHPSLGQRIGLVEKSPQRGHDFKVGELLDKRIDSRVPTILEEKEMSLNAKEEVGAWIDLYLNLYPQIPTSRC